MRPKLFDHDWPLFVANPVVISLFECKTVPVLCLVVAWCIKRWPSCNICEVVSVQDTVRRPAATNRPGVPH